MTSPFTRTRFTWLAYLLLAFYGYLLNILGPIALYLKDEMALSYRVASLHLSAFAVGILLVGIGGHGVIERLGHRRALWLGAAGMSAGAVLLLIGRTPLLTIAAAFLMGLVGSLILAIIPSALADQHGEQRAVALSEANVVASSLSATAPLLVGWFANAPGGWRWALALAALAPAALYAAFGKAPVPAAPSSPKPSGPGPAQLPRLFWAYWAAIVLAVAVEFCMVSWSADYVKSALSLPAEAASKAVSLFLGGMILGRLAGSRLVQRLAAPRLVLFSVLVAAAGFLAYWLAGTAWLTLGGLFLAGLGVASLYPLILSLALETAPGQSVQASARATLASGTAILLAPFLLGSLADTIGIRPAYGVVIVLLVGVFGIVGEVTRKARKGAKDAKVGETSLQGTQKSEGRELG